MPRPPSICVLPYGHHQRSGLHATPLNDLAWPLGRPEWLEDGTVADLGPDDHLILYPRTLTHFRRRSGISARVSLLLLEPALTHARHIAMLRLTWWRFFRILTFHEELLTRIPNGIFFAPGATTIPDWRDFDNAKTQDCALAPPPVRGEGLRLHEALATRLDADTGAARFTVVIEAARERNYFSARLVDAIFRGSVPIYWGCPNLADFFDPSGIVLCENEADICRAVQAASEAEHAARLPQVRALQQVLAPYAMTEQRAARALLASL